MKKLEQKLYKYYQKKYIKYRKKVLSEKQAEFEEYKIQHNNEFVCGINNGFCFKEYCTKDFDKYGCMYLK